MKRISPNTIKVFFMRTKTFSNCTDEVVHENTTS